MKDKLRKIFKALFILTVIILFTFLVFGFIFILNWPMWVGFSLLIGGFGLLTGGYALKIYLERKRGKRLDQQIIEDDEKNIQEAPQDRRAYLKELQEKWKQGIEKIKKSHLKGIYDLPWYLVVGESGAGKTTALRSADLSSPFAEEIKPTEGISGTRNCDWWLYEQAIIIDTAGRLTFQIDEEKDAQEWQKFLNLLSRYRKKEPINGLIVTISAERLRDTPEALKNHAKTIRVRIEELIRILGAKFPIYVLVTKCDLIEGMTQFCAHLPKESLKQPMGVLNHSLTEDIGAFTNQAFEKIDERLKNLRLLLAHSSRTGVAEPGLLIFPEEMKKLKKSLSLLLTESLKKSRFFETPLFRGLFFSSGHQEEAPFSEFLKDMGLIGEEYIPPDTPKGIFLHDFFSRILPQDRNLYQFTRRFIHWQHLTRNMTVMAVAALGVALCGLLTFSFNKNAFYLKESHNSIKPQLTLSGIAPDELKPVVRLSNVIEELETNNKKWFPRVGLYESLSVEEELKERYCKHFQAGPLIAFDKKMEERIKEISIPRNAHVIGRFVKGLLTRIILLKTPPKPQPVEAAAETEKKPAPPRKVVTPFFDSENLGENERTFDQLYLFYLSWCPGYSQQEFSILQRWLQQVIDLNGFKWLVPWYYDQIPPVTLEVFWSGSKTVPDSKEVPGVFTKDGKKEIEKFYDEIVKELPQSYPVKPKRDEFDKYYEELALRSWHDFASDFSRGRQRLDGRQQWQQTASEMVTESGPYFALLKRLNSELGSIVTYMQKPEWYSLVSEFQTMKKAYDVEVGDILKGAADKVGSKLPEGAISSFTKSYNYFKQYMKALAEIEPVAQSRPKAYEIVSLDFKQADSGVSRTGLAISRLQTSMGRDSEEVFWNLVRGPLSFLWDYAKEETACHIQNQWNVQVLQEQKFFKNRYELYKNRNSPLWNFVKGSGTAAPFIRSVSASRFERNQAAFDKSIIPLSNNFFNVINHKVQPRRKRPKRRQRVTSTQQPQVPRTKTIVNERKVPAETKTYSVSIQAFPASVNDNALLKPSSNELVLTCKDKSYRLKSYHQERRATFKWSNQNCSNVILRINVGGRNFTKTFANFPAFLNAFHPDGKHSFSSEAFSGDLSQYGIDFILMEYKFSGHNEVRTIELVKTVKEVIEVEIPGSTPPVVAPPPVIPQDEEPEELPPPPTPRLPESIVKCWDS